MSPFPPDPVQVLPGIRAVPVDRVPVRDQALVSGCGANPEKEAEQQRQRRTPRALHVRLRPTEHPRLSSSTETRMHQTLRGLENQRPAACTMRPESYCFGSILNIYRLLTAFWVISHVISQQE